MSKQQFDEYNFDADTADFQSVMGGGASIYAPSVGTFGMFRDDTMQSRMGRTTAAESVRPMTAISGAGFQSQNNFSNQSSRSGSKNHRVPEKSPEEMVKHLSKEINQILEDSSSLLRSGENYHALQKAQTAVKKDKNLTKIIDEHSLSKQQYQSLTYAAWFHLAKAYEQNGKYDNAIETYETLVRQKRYRSHLGQIRISMGNLYHIQGNYTEAIRMYKMAQDQTARSEKDLKTKILFRIGNIFAKQGKLRDAIKNFEDSVDVRCDNKSFFNLISCYVQLGDEDKSKQTLFRMISATKKPRNSSKETEEDIFDEGFDDPTETKDDGISLLHDAARMVAKMITSKNWIDNFIWVHEQLNRKFPDIAFRIEIELASEHLKRGEFQAAVKIFKSYENDEIESKSMVSTNLSFIYFHEGNYSVADEYADIALTANKYNPNALVNKGNCLFIQEHYDKAREFYLEAIAIKSTCFEAIYNLALTNLRLGQTKEAMQSLVKLHTVSTNDPRVLYQVANLYEDMQDLKKAKKWFNVLSAALPTDPGVLSRLGQIFLHMNDHSQCFHYHLESFRCYPSNIDVAGWLAVWFVKHEMYEKSIHYFNRASQIQPKEIKWKIMIATCYRKIGRHQKSLSLYQNILNDHPENTECLKHIISLCREVGKSSKKHEMELERLQKNVATVVAEPEGRNTKISPSNGSNSTLSSKSGDDSSDASLHDEKYVFNDDVNSLLV